MLRKAFTLPELLVVVAIIVVLASATLSLFRPSGVATREGARIAQSAVLGAKDRALHVRQNRGIQLVVDPANPLAVSGFVLMGAGESVQYGRSDHDLPSNTRIRIERPDADGDGVGNDAISPAANRIRGFDTDWLKLRADGHIGDTFKVQIPSVVGRWHTASNLRAGAAGQELFDIEPPTEYVELGHSWPQATVVDVTCTAAGLRLVTEPRPLPFEAMILLPKNVAVDGTWSAPAGIINASIIFSPSGTISPSFYVRPPFYLLLTSFSDASAGLSPCDPKATGEKLVLRISAHGSVQTFDADLTDADQDGRPDDLFRFAKAGR